MRKWWMVGLAAGMLAGCDDVLDIGDDAEGAVFTMNNAAAANYVVVFERDEEGRLTRMDSVSTGGRGSGPDPTFGTDPLTSQDAVILSDDNELLFVVNAGSDEVSSFRVDGDGDLTLASRVSSGGDFPVSLAYRDGLLYVVNANSGGSISGFTVGNDGALAPLAGSTKPLSGAAMPGPGSIRISPDGASIVVTEKPTNRLVLYALSASGLPGNPVVMASPGPTPFGADFDDLGHYILSQGNVGPNRAAVPDGSSVSSLVLPTATTTTTVTNSLGTTETAACWIQITPDGRYAYTTNTGSGTITGFRIAADGSLTRLTPDGRTAITGPNTQPLDMAYADGFLYALTPGEGGIAVFRVNDDGSLTRRNEAGVGGVLPIGVTGLAAF